MGGKRARSEVAESGTFEVERIVARRERRQAGTEYLVKWQGYPEADNSWEPAAHLPAHLVAAFDKSQSPAPTAKRAGGCAYERRREARIERNQQVLSGLGLQPDQRRPKGSPRPRRKRAKANEADYSQSSNEDTSAEEEETDGGETEEPRAGRWRQFGEALEYVRSLGLPGNKAWYEWSASDARPADIPSHPSRTYAGQGWQGWGHWLGTGTLWSRRREYRPFAEALEFVRSLGLPRLKAWYEWSKSGARPADIPSHPSRTYAGQGWQDWGHWLGTGTLWSRRREYRPFAEALEFAQSLGLPRLKAWDAWSKSSARPADIPSQPNRTYAGQGWQDWGHWLGTGNLRHGKKEWRPFGEALEFVRSLGLSGQKAWHEWCKSDARPADIPSSPHKVYAGQGWQGYGHWLGTGTLCSRRREYRPFTEALIFAQSLGLSCEKAWWEWSKSGARPADMPANPDRVYAGQGWQSWGHWLGTGSVRGGKEGFRPFAEALVFAQSLGLSCKKAWWEWSKSDARPADMPANPDRVYTGQGWQSYGHWLGTGTVAPQNRQFRPFTEAVEFAQSLGLSSQEEWCEWRKSDARPADIPANPYRTYAGQGWQSYGHWLGTGNVGGGRRSAGRALTNSPLSEERSDSDDSDEDDEPSDNAELDCDDSSEDETEDGDGDSFFVERIVARRKRQQAGTEYLVKWQGHPEADNSWEPAAHLPAHLVAAFDKSQSPAPTAKRAGGCAYERRREARIERNQQVLSGLGLQPDQRRPKGSPRPRRKRAKADEADYSQSSNEDTSAEEEETDGGETEEPRAGRWRQFGEALEFVRSLGLQGQRAWYEWSASDARPADIPAAPSTVYAGQGWQSWGHWLGTGNLRGGGASTKRAQPKCSVSAEESVTDDSDEDGEPSGNAELECDDSSEDESEDRDDGESFEVERIVARREPRPGTTEYLVKWQGYPEADNTWEPAAHLPAYLVAAFDESVWLTLSTIMPAWASRQKHRPAQSARIERNQQVLSGLGMESHHSSTVQSITVDGPMEPQESSIPSSHEWDLHTNLEALGKAALSADLSALSVDLSIKQVDAKKLATLCEEACVSGGLTKWDNNSSNMLKYGFMLMRSVNCPSREYVVLVYKRRNQNTEIVRLVTPVDDCRKQGFASRCIKALEDLLLFVGPESRIILYANALQSTLEFYKANGFKKAMVHMGSSQVRGCVQVCKTLTRRTRSARQF